jgi:hypothetical protein
LALFACRDVGVDPGVRDRGQILVRAIAGVREQLRGCGSRLLDDGGDHRHELMLVVRLLGHGLAHDQLQNVDGDLRVVALDESVWALHNPRLQIREVVLRLRLRFGRVRRLARSRGLRLRASLQRPFRLPDPRQAALAPLQFRRQFVALLIRSVRRVIGGIRRVGLREQLPDLVAQLALFRGHAAVANGFVFRGVRFDLCAVQRHTTDPRRPQLARQAEDLFEEALQRRQVSLPKIPNRAVVRHVAGGQHPERHVFDQPALNAAGREHADTVRVDEHLRHHHRVVRRVAPLVLLVHDGDGRQIQLVDQVADEECQVALRQPVSQTRRQQQILLGHVRTIRLGHRPQCRTAHTARSTMIRVLV